MLAFLIILGIILYIIVGVIVFVIFSRIDFFDEYTSDFRYMDFPTDTFLCSVFWIIILPMFLIGAICDLIKDWIEVTGYVIYEKARRKRKEKEKQ